MEYDERYAIHIDQKVAILIDANNIEINLKKLTNNDRAVLNFDTAIPKLLDGRSLNRLVYFKEGPKVPEALEARLKRRFYGTVKGCHKSADIPLTIKAIQLSNKVDTIIILSGDADYIELVKQLKSDGVRVEIASIYGATASALISTADDYHEIDESDAFYLK